MTTSAETVKRSSNELNTFSTKPLSLQSITEDYTLLIYGFNLLAFLLKSKNQKNSGGK